ncbi:MAG: hypothetical protein HUU49_02730 [Candidatus Buchananbacteria bacterium]|nr:hypothetical protein [Candidatus Buchananbacteria bacterium]
MTVGIKQQRGQGLLEAVFAIGIMVMVVSAVLALTTSNVIGQRQSELQVVGNNLAREGLEVIRNIRDSNWLSGTNWDAGLVGGSEALVVFSEANNSWELDFNIVPGKDRLYLSTSGVYSHDPALGQPSLFSRRIGLQSICQNSDGEDLIKTSCDSGEQKIGLKARSVVTWQESGRNRQVAVEALMYEWK